MFELTYTPIKFLFQIGAIKSDTRWEKKSVKDEFLFQIGAIKSDGSIVCITVS